MIRGILFDFDGTLANTIDLIVAAFEHTCRTALGFAPPRREIINTIGLPLGEALELLTHRPDLTPELRRIYGCFNERNHDRMIRPIPGAAELLAELKRRGLAVAVVSSKKPAMLQRGMDCLQLTPYVDAVVAVTDTEHGKPHPEPMLLASSRLGLLPGECLCVGDSPYDLQSGRAAGALTVAVAYTTFDWQQLLEEGRPDYSIGQPGDLLRIIDALNSKEEALLCEK